MRDIQRQKVYDWEDSQSFMIKKSYLTEKQCHAVIKRLNKIFRKQVTLRFKNGHGSCWAFNKRDILIRNDWGRSYGVLLHEYAHCLTGDKHGKSFVSEFCVLLHYLHPLQPSISELAKSLNKANVDFGSFDKTISKKKLTKRHKPFEDVCTDPLPVPIKKKRVSAKQKIETLLEKYDSLYVSYYYGDIYVSYKDKEECIYNGSWKSAYEKAIEMIEVNTKCID
jgi:hypothetical protein